MAGAAARVLIVTDARNDEALIALLAAGLDGLKSKGTGATAPRILEVVRTPTPVAAVPVLTERQTDVLRLLSQGQSNKEIARTLGVSPATVKTHVAQLIAILGAANRTDAAMKARIRGLL